MPTLREKLRKLLPFLFSEPAVDYTKIIEKPGSQTPASIATTAQTAPSRKALADEFKNAEKRDECLGYLSAALDHQDKTATIAGLENLMQLCGDDLNIVEPVRSTFSQLMAWADADTVIQATDIVTENTEIQALIEISDDISLQVLVKAEADDPLYAMSIYCNIVRDDEGTNSDKLMNSALEGMQRLVQSPRPLLIPQFLAEIESLYTDIEQGSKKNRPLEDMMLHLADQVQADDPITALDSYALVLEHTDEDDSRNPDLARQIIPLAKRARYLADEEALEKMQMAINVLDENDPIAKEGTAFVKAEENPDDPKEYSEAKPISASNFAAKHRLAPGPQ